ncbi:LytTR family DNA-binding domain-containing protein [Sphingosinicella sp. CPCC 101087]|uniref:LytTR family DNA-binding domain-containing protein n=1 Tax=Sphingosinicella sp. CPCC 101087 TaxID=2497754 RepID=UPI00101B5F00|nr:LytTR family DNA-binding domain-containing protein [Sphingosinicella sp. CPCC 101087]
MTAIAEDRPFIVRSQPLRTLAPFLLVPLGTVYCQLYEIFIAHDRSSVWASFVWAAATLVPWSLAVILFDRSVSAEHSRRQLLLRAALLAILAYLASGAAALLLSGTYERAFFTRLPAVAVALLAAGLYPRPPRPAKPIAAADGESVIPIPPKEIDLASAAGNYIELHANGRSTVWRQTMHNAERILGPAGFIRVHRSYLVPRRSIEAVRRGRKGPVEVALRNGRKVPVSRCYAANLRD